MTYFAKVKLIDRVLNISYITDFPSGIKMVEKKAFKAHHRNISSGIFTKLIFMEIDRAVLEFHIGAHACNR